MCAFWLTIHADNIHHPQLALEPLDQEEQEQAYHKDVAIEDASR